MSKFNKVLSIVLVVMILLGAMSVATYAATGKTIIKEIIDKYFVDDVEVSKEAYDSAVLEANKAPEVEYETEVIEHKFYTDTKTTEYVYKINGQVVSESEFESYTITDETSEITFTSADLTGLNAGSLGDYLNFTTDNYGNIVSAKIKSNSVIGVKYTYCDDYLSFCSQDESGNYIFDYTGNGFIYNKGNQVYTINGCTSTYFVADENKTDSKNVSVNDIIFTFENNNNYAPITFGRIFESITLITK